MKKVIIITGQVIELTKLEKPDLKGVYVDAAIRFNFYKGQFGGHSFILLESKKDEILKPLQYKQIANSLEKVLHSPILFEFDKMETYKRNRLIERGVYFVISDKYIFLPFLIVNAKDLARVAGNELTPAAQYILLSQIQDAKFNNLTIKEIEKITPYKYVTLTRAIRVLEEFRLCKSIIGEDKAKRLQFTEANELWAKAQSYLINPVAKVVYCSEADAKIVCSYNALSHYSSLNPDSNQEFAIYERDYKEFESNSQGLNDYEGDITIEVWKYPPISEGGYVDRLSLYLTLKDDSDPRVSKELDKMIKELW